MRQTGTRRTGRVPHTFPRWPRSTRSSRRCCPTPTRSARRCRTATAPAASAGCGCCGRGSRPWTSSSRRDLVIVPASSLAGRRPGAGGPRRSRPDARPQRRLGAAARPGAGDRDETRPAASPHDALAELGRGRRRRRAPRHPRPRPATPRRSRSGSSGSSSTGAASSSASRRVLEADLAQLAMAARGVESLVAAIGAFLDRAVALEGRRSDTIALHAPADVPDAAGRRRGVPRPPAVGRQARAAPRRAGRDRRPSGWLVLLGRPAGRATSRPSPRSASRRCSSLELLVESQVRRARDESARGDALPSDGPPWVVMVARQPESIAGDPSREEVRQELRFRFAARRLSLRGTSESLDLRGDRRAGAGRPAGPPDRGPRGRVPRPDGRASASRSARPRRPPRGGGQRTRDARRRGATRRAAAGGARGPTGRVSAALVVGQPARRPDAGDRAARTAARRAPGERARTAGDAPGGPGPRRGGRGRESRWESTATRWRTASATSRPEPGGIWPIRSSAWPCPSRSVSCNPHNKTTR